ncbi:CAP domain-containing protein [Albimonas sp. CAU 1670]|uniref:CAP domain-containing protein n=1 Tax=Albimonas sp. CAU 1670 TaxID=3032599 RepID=UPI0023D9891F|nr:CAP domain-containing protein [Albimonas sp. CAU 1670]MDF2232302.1 CAP domain-containing protein [Albimonas sp. CAU 1670]
MRAAALAAALALALPAAPAAALDCPPTPAAAEALRTDFAVALDRLRGGEDLAPVPRAPRIEAAAQDWAGRLAAMERLSHRDAEGRGVGDRLTAAGVAWRFAAENLAAGDLPDAAALLALWVESPAHRRNLLAPEAARHGLGAACDGRGRPVFALMLAG